jgi:hypothetical protein
LSVIAPTKPLPEPILFWPGPGEGELPYVATALRDRNVDLPSKTRTEIEGNVALQPCSSLKSLIRSTPSVLPRIAEHTAPVLAGSVKSLSRYPFSGQI